MSDTLRGDYRYRRDGVVQPITEPWQLERQGEMAELSGERRIDGELAFGVRARYAAGHCQTLQLDWRAGARVRAEYRLDAAQLHWRFDAGAWESSPADDGALMFPLLRAAAGLLLAQLDERPRPVIVPNLHRGPAQPPFLTPRITPRHCRPLACEDGVTHYRYFGGEYGEAGSDYHVGADGILRFYRWESPDGVWEVERVDSERSSPGRAE